ncbi:Myosin rod fragments domain-containing protein [Dioscorea alata]|uniref:Myosin rods domain-containing protein n=1 Tax=Dioscorea alata TaxID=55571 RepID=A0ACB7VIB1_DIOAL|nr:Myosin rod fragments domain-containing protein [Dioscorea alata]
MHVAGVTTNIKLLLKLLHDHCDISKEADGRRPQRVAGMITILDDVKARIEKSQKTNKRAELRRCNTDLRRGQPQPHKEKRPPSNEPLSPSEENQKLKKELWASMTARKSLERMFSSLAKEKQMITAELTRKVHELKEMEELVNDLKEHNETLSEKIKALATDSKEKESNSSVLDCCDNVIELRQQNKELSEQLVKSLDRYRSMKRRVKDVQDVVSVSLERMSGLHDCVDVEVQKEFSQVEEVLVGFLEKFSKDSPKREE